MKHWVIKIACLIFLGMIVIGVSAQENAWREIPYFLKGYDGNMPSLLAKPR